MNDAQALKPIRVWDLPVRLFHWLLVLLVIVSYVSGKVGGNWLEWHQRSGFAILGLICFRIAWGFVGGYHARFANFLRGPKSVIAYLKSAMWKGQDATIALPRYTGHNPLGAVNVLAMLCVLLLQALLGLFSNDDVMLEGPYARLISKELSDQLSSYHKLGSDLILILVGLHVIAIAFAWFYRKENLVKPMITGDKLLPADAATPKRPAWLAWVISACVAIVVYAAVIK